MSAIIDIERTHLASTGARYRVWHEGEILLESTRNPLCDAARALVAQGVTGRLQMRRLGATRIDAEGLIAVLATVTVSEGQESGPRFAKWSPYRPAEAEAV